MQDFIQANFFANARNAINNFDDAFNRAVADFAAAFDHNAKDFRQDAAADDFNAIAADVAKAIVADQAAFDRDVVWNAQVDPFADDFANAPHVKAIHDRMVQFVVAVADVVFADHDQPPHVRHAAHRARRNRRPMI